MIIITFQKAYFRNLSLGISSLILRSLVYFLLCKVSKGWEENEMIRSGNDNSFAVMITDRLSRKVVW